MRTEANLISGAQVMAAIEAAGIAPIHAPVAQKLADYGNLLMRWNARTNLTAIRTADGILQRHLVECVAAAQALPGQTTTLLDYGSGAGLPGIPIALVRPEIDVTLAESQSRKVAFLREAARSLQLKVILHSGRVMTLPSTLRYDCVTLRAVDNMAEALGDAVGRVKDGGTLAVFATANTESALRSVTIHSQGWVESLRTALPTVGYLLFLKHQIVPRGTI